MATGGRVLEPKKKRPKLSLRPMQTQPAGADSAVEKDATDGRIRRQPRRRIAAKNERKTDER